MYRVWCMNNKEWEKYVLLTPSGRMLEMVNNIPRPLNPHTHILQFNTQMKDSKGNDIFEGDLLMCKELSMPIEVWYDGGNWLAGINSDDDRCDDYLWRTLAQFKNCTIVGNVFEGVIKKDDM